MRGGQRVQGIDVLLSTVFGGVRKWMLKTKYNITWGRPIPKARPYTVQKAVHFLQLCLLCVLHWRTHCLDSPCLGPNPLWHGPWLWCLHCRHASCLDLLALWHFLLQKQPSSWQHLHPNCSSNFHYSSFLSS